jgi:hypothetical protein
LDRKKLPEIGDAKTYASCAGAYQPRRPLVSNAAKPAQPCVELRLMRISV